MPEISEQEQLEICITRMPWKDIEIGLFLVRTGDGQAIELQVENLARPSMVGQIHIGRIQKYLPSLHAAFVDIADQKKVFLPVKSPDELNYVRRQSKSEGIHGGDQILLQIVADPIKSKDAIGSSDIVFKSADVIAHLGSGESGISRKISGQDRRRLRDFLSACQGENYHLTLRTSAADLKEEELTGQVEALVEQMEDFQATIGQQALFTVFQPGQPLWMERLMTYPAGQIASITSDLEEVIASFAGERNNGSHTQGSKGCSWTRRADSRLADYAPLFHAYRDEYPLYQLRNLTRLMKEISSRTVWLPCGGNIVIEQTEALNVIDINTGKMKAGGGKRDAVLTCNLQAAEEIARQMRLRNLSGIIIIDFINMRDKRDLTRVMEHLSSCCKRDPQGVSLVDVTALGLVEITRQKKYASLKQILSS